MTSTIKPTIEYTPEEQFSAALAAGISPPEMLRNVDALLRRLADGIVRECSRSGNTDYAEAYVRRQADLMLAVRETRAYVLSRALEVAT